MPKRKNIILCIDSANADNTQVILIIDGKEKVFNQPALFKSQSLLPLIETALRKEKIELEDITEIKVNEHGGSFTGVRVGVAVANTLAYTLNIKVNGKTSETPNYHPSRFD